MLGWSAGEVDALVLRHLERARFEVLKEGRVAPEGAPTFRASLAIEAEEPDPTRGRVLRVAVRLTLRARAAGGFDIETQQSVEARSSAVDDLQVAAREALDRALSDVAEQGRWGITFERQSDEEVSQRLQGSGPRARAAAIRTLARRRNPTVLPLLLEELATEDLDRIRRTMGLLVELGDPAAVPALIEAARAKDNVVQREVAFALGGIGGDDAEAYLYTLAQGHDDPMVRASAEQALTELRTRHQPSRAGDSP